MKTSGVILDTHAWIWWVNDSSDLSERSREYIEQAIVDKHVYLSAISAWEVTLLVQQKRLVLTMDVQYWIAQTQALPFVSMVPVDVTIAVQSVRLPGDFHKDPADRIIVATALRLGLTVITRDGKIQKYPYIQTIW